MQPTRIRAMPPTGHGDVPALAYRRDLPVADPGPGEVRVRFRSAAVSNTAINPRTDWHSKPDAISSLSYSVYSHNFGPPAVNDTYREAGHADALASC